MKWMGRGLVCLVLHGWGGAAGAQEAGNGADATNAPPAAEEPLPPAKAYRGSDMGEAFKGAGSSRFGVSGRVNKMPAKKSAKREKEAWRRNIEFGVNTSRGNSDTLRYNGSVSGSRETDANYLYLKAGGRYGESEQQTDVESASGEAKFQRLLTERMYAALDVNALHDQIAALSYRARGSVSLGRHFIRTERTVLSAELGPGYVAEKKGGESEGFVAGRVAQYLEFLITDSLQVWQAVEYIPDLEDSAVYFINGEIGLETVLLSNLNLRFTIEDRYDNRPAEGKERNDLLTTTALVWNF
jgi:putative salt-induced outer membrane protein YdiY